MDFAGSRIAAALADRYRLEEEVGQGGLATVYLARDLRHARQVAVKVLRPDLAAVIGAERFLAEIRTTANLQHPHILPLFDSGEADGLLFYVMPYVEGESLRTRLTREKQLPVADAVRIAAPLWSRRGDELFYVNGNREMVSVALAFESAEPRVAGRSALFRLPAHVYLSASEYYTPYDVASDGRFIMARSVQRPDSIVAAVPVIVVENWFSEVRAQLRR